MADDHPLSVAVPFAAEQREGVVPASQTCKQILLSSATTEGWASALELSVNHDQPIQVSIQEYSFGEEYLVVRCFPWRWITIFIRNMTITQKVTIECGP